MQSGKIKIITIYVVLPLLLLAFSMGTLTMLVSANGERTPADYISGRAFSTLAAKPVSLLTPYSSGDIYNEMLSVKDLFDEYNEDYGDRLSVRVAKSYLAKLSKMKYYISTTERMHLASHGTWSSSAGPKIVMYGSDLTREQVDTWGLTGGLCKVIYLSACNSMGHNGILDTSLADKLIARTSADSVVGFKDVANIVGATLLSQSFWMFHVCYASIGGMSNFASYTNTRDRVNRRIDYTAHLLAIGASVSIAGAALLAGVTSGVALIFLAAIIEEIVSTAAFVFLLADLQDTVNNWEIVGAHVPGLSWYSGGGGGGGTGPIDVPY